MTSNMKAPSPSWRWLAGWIFLVGASLTLSFEVQASPRVGNGGGAWLCRNKNEGSLRWLQLVDLFEGENDYGLHFHTTPDRVPWNWFQDAYDRIRSEVPELAQLLTTDAAGLQNRLTILPSSSSLTLIDDGAFRVLPNPTSCEEGYLLYGQIANFTDDGRLLIARDLWSDPAMSNFARGALLVHEMIYKTMREQKGDLNSFRSRLIVALVLADLSPEERRSRIHDALAMKNPDPVQPPPQAPIRLVCHARVDQAGQDRAVYEEMFDDPQPGQPASRSSLGFYFELKSEAQSGRPLEIRIKDLKSGIVATQGPEILIPTFQKYRSVRIEMQNESTGVTAQLACWPRANALNSQGQKAQGSPGFLPNAISR